MGTKKDPATSKESAGNIAPLANDVGGKLRLNKQTLQDLSPTEAHADKVRGGAKPCSVGASGCGDT